jgi:hypothetical protein
MIWLNIKDSIMRMTLIFVLCAVPILTSAQETGTITYKELGLQFTIPEGWVGQESQTGFVMGHTSIAGLVLITTHNYSGEQLIQEARKGIADNQGTQLQLSGDLEVLNDHTIGGEFQGTLEWQAARAFIVGLANPDGMGISIMAMTTAEQYNHSYRDLALRVMASVQFSKPETGPVVEEWKKYLSGVKLTYMESYSSPSYTDGGVSGFYENKEKIDLCDKGYFNHYSYNLVSVEGQSANDGTLVHASDGGQKYGNGTWEIEAGTGGSAILRLLFHDGRSLEYTLSEKDDKTFLNGYRYFRTWTGENAPTCPF